jgi:hypothetical protein
MFAVRKRPLLLVADRLLSLRPSLNTPIVSTPELPAGPARAALAVHVEGGQRRISVAVRALRGGASVLYELEDEDLNGASGYAVALDAALSFGESMGFLFDDERITDRRPETLRHAVARLRELVAPPDPGGGEEIAEADESEILLEEAIDAGTQELRPTPVGPGGEDEVGQLGIENRAPAPAAPVVLTKFRRVASSAVGPTKAPDEAAAGSSTDAPGANGPARLGRVRPVRLRSGGGDGTRSVSPLLRFLSGF